MIRLCFGPMYLLSTVVKLIILILKFCKLISPKTSNDTMQISIRTLLFVILISHISKVPPILKSDVEAASGIVHRPRNYGTFDPVSTCLSSTSSTAPDAENE